MSKYVEYKKKSRGCFVVTAVIILTAAYSSTDLIFTRLHARQLHERDLSSFSCTLSMKESFNFFCESDLRWELRKNIFRVQEARQTMPKHDHFFRTQRGVWIMNNYEPSFSCEFDQRIGRQGDGGKWVCNPNRIRELSNSNSIKCSILSLGSNNDFSFEKGINQELPDCDIHTFDHTIAPVNVPNFVTFHSFGLGLSDKGSLKSFPTIMKDDNISGVEILKIDIESAEWDIFVGREGNRTEGLLSNVEIPFIRQILIEIHPLDIPRTRAFFDLMRKHGYVITHKEPNLHHGGKLVEYAFLKLNLGE